MRDLAADLGLDLEDLALDEVPPRAVGGDGGRVPDALPRARIGRAARDDAEADCNARVRMQMRMHKCTDMYTFICMYTHADIGLDIESERERERIL